MRAAVYDTYVVKKDHSMMHFDIIVEENTNFEKVQSYGQHYLKEMGQEGQQLTAKECRFCHIEKAGDLMENEIIKNGYFILEMEGCV